VEALSRAYDRCGSRVYDYVRSIVGSPDAAEDVLQEVFCRLAARGAIFEVRDVEAYLFRVARNEALRWIARRPRPEVALNDAPEPAAPAPDPSRGDLREAVLRALKRLPPEQAEVVHLRAYEDMTFEEIAEFTGCSVNTATSRWRYASDRLKRMLREWTHE
jgi:RNA polymerase sigma-70 factor (ECF subfamily)